MPAGIVSRISNEQYTVLAVEPEAMNLTSGDTLPLGDTYCSVVVSKNTTMAVTHTAKDPALLGHPAYRTMQLEAYLATPIRVNGEIYRTLNFTSPEIRKTPFDDTDVELIELMAGLFGYTADELLALDFQTLTHPDDLDTDLEFLEEMLSGERDAYRMHKRYFHKNGRRGVHASAATR